MIASPPNPTAFIHTTELTLSTAANFVHFVRLNNNSVNQNVRTLLVFFCAAPLSLRCIRNFRLTSRSPTVSQAVSVALPMAHSLTHSKAHRLIILALTVTHSLTHSLTHSQSISDLRSQLRRCPPIHPSIHPCMLRHCECCCLLPLLHCLFIHSSFIEIGHLSSHRSCMAAPTSKVCACVCARVCVRVCVCACVCACGVWNHFELSQSILRHCECCCLLPLLHCLFIHSVIHSFRKASSFIHH